MSHGDPIARKNLPLWIVGEEPLVIQPYQKPDADMVLPLNAASGNIAPVDTYFNEDSDGGTSPLPLVILNSDRVEIISPTHRWISLAQMQGQLPVVNGRVRPQYSVFTDNVHQENDGYKYGIRNVRMSNITLFSNKNVGDYDKGFYLRGLWKGLDTYGARDIMNGCFFDSVPDDGVGKDITVDYSIPTTGSFPYPPSTSKYFWLNPATGTKEIPRGYMPYVFRRLWDEAAIMDSSIIMSGLRIVAPFSTAVVEGRNRAIGVSVKQHNSYYLEDVADMSQRNFSWNQPYYFGAVTNASCGAAVQSPGGTLSSSIRFLVNSYDGAPFIQNMPPDDYRGLGSIAASELPTIQSAQ